MYEEKHVLPVLRQDTGPTLPGDAHTGGVVVYADIFRSVRRVEDVTALYTG